MFLLLRGTFTNLQNSFQIKGINIPWVYELAINIFIKLEVQSNPTQFFWTIYKVIYCNVSVHEIRINM